MPLVAMGAGGWTLLVLLALVIALFVVLALNYRKVGPNEVLIVAGGLGQTVTEPDGTVRRLGYKMRIGGGAFVLPLFQSAQILPLEIFTVQVKVAHSLTKGGVHLNAVGMAQLKVGSDEAMIRRAAEQFLGRGSEAIREVTRQVLEGELRAHLGSFTVEEVYQERDGFNERMEKSAATDLAKMGLDLLSFTLADISDDQGYLEALGTPRIAAVKRDAEIAQADMDKEAAIQTAESRKLGDVARLRADTEVAQANRDFEMARADFAADVNRKKASADVAYDLERQKSAQQMKEEELKVRIVERQKLIELEELEIARKEKELKATVEKTAESRQLQVRLEAEAEAYRLEAEAKGRAAAERLVAETEAEGIRARGEAEATAMRSRADAYQNYNEAAIYEMLIKILPDLAKSVSEPLSKLDKIVIVDAGGDGRGVTKVTGQVAQVLSQLPSVVEALGGVDLKALAERFALKNGEEQNGRKAALEE